MSAEEQSGQTCNPEKDSKEEALKPIETVLEGISEKKKREIIEVFKATIFQGPLPPPDILKEYYSIDPELPKLLKEMPAKEQEHRHLMNEGKLNLKKYEAKTDRIEIILGQTFAFSICALVVLAGSYIALSGQPVVGGLLTIGGLGGLASAFIWGRKGPSRKSDDKQPG